MAAPEARGQATAVRDHGFHALRIARVVRETEDASSFVIDVPDELRDAFAYRAGQFVTFRVVVDGHPQLRSYSMSSAPGVDDELQVTVKRVPGGLVSNWLLDRVGPGDEVEMTFPAGVFCLSDEPRDVVAFAAGSGITPVHSLLKAALSGPGRRGRLLYANRDRAATIFAADLDRLEAEHGDRLSIEHHLDAERGFVDAATVHRFLVGLDLTEADVYVCGPGPFMDIVEGVLLDEGVARERIHIERFSPAAPVPPEPAEADASAATRVTIELDGRTETTDHRPGTTILQTARQVGLSPPFSCEAGSCATCMARLVEGTASMHANDALTDDEVEDGFVLTCQAVPTSPTVHVRYGYE